MVAIAWWALVILAALGGSMVDGRHNGGVDSFLMYALAAALVFYLPLLLMLATRNRKLASLSVFIALLPVLALVTYFQRDWKTLEGSGRDMPCFKHVAERQHLAPLCEVIRCRDPFADHSYMTARGMEYRDGRWFHRGRDISIIADADEVRAELSCDYTQKRVAMKDLSPEERFALLRAYHQTGTAGAVIDATLRKLSLR